jgi:WD40 repeat protein
VLFTHDDAHLVTSNNHGFIEVWDVTSGKRAWSRLHHASHEHERYLFSERRSTLLDYYAIALAASNNGSRLASAGRDGRICIWQQSDGTCERIIPFPYDSKEDETRLSFSHDDAILIGATNGKHIRLWDVATGNLFEEQTCEQVERFAKGFSATDARSIKIASAYNGAGKGTIRIRELAR